MVQPCIQSYGLFHVYANVARDLSQLFAALEDGDSDQFLKICNGQMQGFSYFQGLMMAIMISISRKEVKVEDLLGEREIAVIAAQRTIFGQGLANQDAGPQEKEKARKILEAGTCDFIVSRDEKSFSAKVIFDTWGFEFDLSNFAPERRYEIGLQIFSIIHSASAKSMAQLLERAAARFESERACIEELVSRFNDLQKRAVPSQLRVSARIFNSAKHVAAVSSSGRLKVSSEGIKDLELRVVGKEEDETGVQLKSRDNLKISLEGDVPEDQRQDLYNVFQAGNSYCQLALYGITRKGSKAVLSNKVLFKRKRDGLPT